MMEYILVIDDSFKKDMSCYLNVICFGFLVRPLLFAPIPLSDQVWLADSVTTSKQVIYWLTLHMGSHIKHLGRQEWVCGFLVNSR